MLNIYYKKIANSDFDYNKSEIGKKITDIAVNILNSKVIDMSEPLDLIGFDSIKYITFIVELENEFDIEFGEDKLTMASFKDMNELMNYLSNLQLILFGGDSVKETINSLPKRHKEKTLQKKVFAEFKSKDELKD